MTTNDTIKIVYADVYGEGFSRTVDGARAFAQRILENGWADLDDYGKSLKHKPRCVYGNGRNASSWNMRALLIHPLDYDKSDAGYLLETLS